MISVEGIVFVCGAASGIGRATALAFARAGSAGIHIADINFKNLKETAAELIEAATNSSFRVHLSELDITNEENILETLRETVSVFGRLDYAVNAAGVAEARLATADLSTEQFDRVNDVNQRGAFIIMREELRLMREQELVARLPGRPAVRGAITNVASLLGLQALEGYTSYVTSKHAVIGMTRSAAASHARDGIRVNSICPGWVDTPLLTGLDKAKLAESVPQNRLASPDEIADVILFLTSERASYVTGASWVTDGGWGVI